MRNYSCDIYCCACHDLQQITAQFATHVCTHQINMQGNILLSIGAPKGLIIAADLFVVGHSSSVTGLIPVLHAEVPQTI